MRLLVGSLVRLLVGKSYHTKQKDGYSWLTNDPTNNPTNWIWTSKKIGLKYIENFIITTKYKPNDLYNLNFDAARPNVIETRHCPSSGHMRPVHTL